jgi:hypothetical protein
MNDPGTPWVYLPTRVPRVGQPRLADGLCGALLPGGHRDGYRHDAARVVERLPGGAATCRSRSGPEGVVVLRRGARQRP